MAPVLVAAIASDVTDCPSIIPRGQGERLLYCAPDCTLQSRRAAGRFALGRSPHHSSSSLCANCEQCFDSGTGGAGQLALTTSASARMALYPGTRLASAAGPARAATTRLAPADATAVTLAPTEVIGRRRRILVSSHWHSFHVSHHEPHNLPRELKRQRHAQSVLRI